MLALLCSLLPFIFARIPGCQKKCVENPPNPPGAVFFGQANDMTNVAGCIPIAPVLVWLRQLFFPKLETWFRTRTTGSTKHSPKATGVLNRRDGGGLPGKWRFTSHFTKKEQPCKMHPFGFRIAKCKKLENAKRWFGLTQCGFFNVRFIGQPAELGPGGFPERLLFFVRGCCIDLPWLTHQPQLGNVS